MRNLIPLHSFLYSRLLVFYPADLRARFGRDMVEIFEDLLADSASRGPAAIISLWVTAICELLSVALPLRLQNTRAVAAAISFLISSALAWFFFRSVS